ncbi:50S ribosome-binding GTPase [Motilibacter rhizosphaerae]|uniref:50S ribosome-binding GTPase n=1 Tax=Motilibacter rhizosphaerae TaxID=598652 RepID=A0A4Q7NW42_9ACTN|nr:GTPase [Motilibacter rhizosphaerae]RZS91506.1 50S ribosome-binding GTPase [Motilibacter rhizosphaerae]
MVTRLLSRRRRGGPDLASRVEALDTVVRLGGGGFDPELLDSARAVLDRAGARLRLSGEHTVVAVAGGTGSGKSTLVNALAGTEVSPPGVRRPTTSHSVAALWGPAGAGPLLDWLGVPERHVVDGSEELAGLVLLDLPDHDSTALDHRLEVDRLVELVDLLVWVVDPQKYADAALHERYLQRLRAHRAVTLVALNQVDLLTPEDAEVCAADLRRLLRADGLADVALVSVSARTGEGVAELQEALAGAVARRTAAVERLTADVDRAVEELDRDLGTGSPPAGGTVGRAERARLREALAVAGGVPAVEAAVEQSVRRQVHAATGWPVTRWAGRLRRDPLSRLRVDAAVEGSRSSLPPASPVARAGVDAAVRGLADAASAPLPDRWAQAVRAAARSRSGDLDDALDRAVSGTPVSAARRPWWVPPLAALQWVVTAAAVVGLLWLAALFVVDWVRLPEPPTYDVGRIPLPTTLLVLGVLAGLLIASLGSALGRRAGRRAARRAGGRLRDAVAEVGEVLVVAPVKDELQRYAVVREALRRAG